MSTLEQYLDSQVEVLATPETCEAFKIETIEQANWACRKLAQIRRKQGEIKDAAQREITRIQDWAFSETQKLDGEARFFEDLLEGFHRRRLAEDPKAKTITLPHGVLKLRAQQPEYNRDENELLPWVEANRPEMVRVKKETDWAKVKAALKFIADPERLHFLIAIDPETGERVPGIEALERPDKFSVEVKA